LSFALGKPKGSDAGTHRTPTYGHRVRIDHRRRASDGPDGQNRDWTGNCRGVSPDRHRACRWTGYVVRVSLSWKCCCRESGICDRRVCCRSESSTRDAADDALWLVSRIRLNWRRHRYHRTCDRKRSWRSVGSHRHRIDNRLRNVVRKRLGRKNRRRASTVGASRTAVYDLLCSSDSGCESSNSQNHSDEKAKSDRHVCLSKRMDSSHCPNTKITSPVRKQTNDTLRIRSANATRKIKRAQRRRLHCWESNRCLWSWSWSHRAVIGGQQQPGIRNENSKEISEIYGMLFIRAFCLAWFLPG